MLPSSHPPSVVFASKFNGLRERRCAPGRSCRSARGHRRPPSRRRAGARGAARSGGRWQRRHRRRGGRAVRRRHRRPDQGQGPLVHHAAGPVRAGAGAGRSRPDRVIYVDACDEKSVLACFEEGVRHGGLGAVVAEVATAFDDVVAPAVACGRSLRLDRDRGAPMAAADRGRGLRTADGVRDEMAGVDAAVDASSGAGRRPRPMAARVDPMPRRRKRGFCSGCV